MKILHYLTTLTCDMTSEFLVALQVSQRNLNDKDLDLSLKDPKMDLLHEQLLKQEVTKIDTDMIIDYICYVEFFQMPVDGLRNIVQFIDKNNVEEIKDIISPMIYVPEHLYFYCSYEQNLLFGRDDYIKFLHDNGGSCMVDIEKLSKSFKKYYRNTNLKLWKPFNAMIYSNFYLICGSGDLELAKWLYQISRLEGGTKIDIHARDDYAFRYSCENGHLEVAEWLYQLSLTEGETKIDIHADNDSPFKLSYCCGHAGVVQWLYQLSLTEGETEINIYRYINEYAQSRKIDKWYAYPLVKK